MLEEETKLVHEKMHLLLDPILKFGGIFGPNFRILLETTDDRKSLKTKQYEAYYRQESSHSRLTRHIDVRI